LELGDGKIPRLYGMDKLPDGISVEEAQGTKISGGRLCKMHGEMCVPFPSHGKTSPRSGSLGL
jgi:hypothetical protein